MLASTRKFAKSPLGVGIFAVIVIAFIVTLYQGGSGLGDMSLGGGGQGVARVGSKSVDEVEISRRVQNQLDGARQQDPTIDMARFLADGGLERTIDLTLTGRALEVFAADQGMVASKKLIDGQIASIPAFFGPTGKFDPNTFQQVLSARKLNEKMIRDDFAREAITKMLAIPVAGAARVPEGIVAPYASLLLETREGLVAALPSEAFALKTAPTDAEVQSFYQRNLTRYTVPERRVIRYATFDKSKVAAAAQATDAEIEAVYKADTATYGARQTRSFSQLIVPTQSEATALLARIRGGQSMADAGRSVRRDVIAVPATDEKGFAQLTGPQVAAAAFKTPQGQFAPIERSGLGFHIVRVDGIQTVAATPLSAVRGKLAAELTGQKERRLIADLVAKIEDAAGNGATVDELVKAHGLTAQATPPLTEQGLVVDVDYAITPAAQTVLPQAFLAEPDDDPAVVALPENAGYVLWKLDRTLPSAPKPLAELRPQVIADVQNDKGSKAAKVAADRIVAAVNAGTPMANAVAAAGVPLPAPQPARARRLEIAQAQEPVPPPIQTLFTIPQGRARAAALPQRQGWYIVQNIKITSGDARQAPGLIQATQQQLSGAIGDEYVQQFAAAVRARVGVKKNDAAIARVKRTLAGGR